MCREGEAKGFTGRDWERNRVVNVYREGWVRVRKVRLFRREG